MIVVIDNYDSFTYNLVQYLGQLGEEVVVYRNDKITSEKLRKISPQRIIISPGPGRPDDAGISKEVIREFSGKIPILGVCLGHQCIGEVYGGRIVRAGNIMHGKVSSIFHNGEGVFKGIPSPFTATRYHSLVIEPGSMGKELEVTAWTEADEIMGVRHRALPVFGVQFHPESVLTSAGIDILRNFINI